MVGKAEEGYSNHSPNTTHTFTPMTYEAVIIPQPIITPLPPAITYLIGAFRSEEVWFFIL